MPSKPIRLLIVGAHPADAFDQAGGTLAHHAAEGDHVSALIVTGGVRSHDWRLRDRYQEAGESFDLKKESDESKNSKADEVRRACGMMGIKDLHFLVLEDDAVKWTRLSCHDFRDNEVRLQLFALAYNLANFVRRLALPGSVKHWSLTTLREKLVKIGAKVVRHVRYVTFQMAEVAIPRRLFAAILRRIARVRPVPV
jgi:LmbE family N-acetylglucosaminyl deacetylase